MQPINVQIQGPEGPAFADAITRPIGISNLRKSAATSDGGLASTITEISPLTDSHAVSSTLFAVATATAALQGSPRD